MKLCAVSNYIKGYYINESLIFNKISSLLDIKESNIFNPKDLNLVYSINRNYSHILIYFDYSILSLEEYNSFLSEIEIPKIFIIDTIPQKHKELNEEISKLYYKGNVNSLNCLSLKHQEFLYNKHADGLIFFSEIDQKLFKEYYNVNQNIPQSIIPPPLGKKDNLKINYNNFLPNNNIGFNGEFSYANGFLQVKETFPHLSNYSLDVFGTAGRSFSNTSRLINDILNESANIKFRGKLKDYNSFFKLYHIYLSIALYDSFDYFTFLSILNGMVPILNRDSGTSSYFKSYPFIATPNINSIKYTIELITNTPKPHLKDILENTLEDLYELSNENILFKYKSFLNEV